jgi:hypothetical protein
MSLFGEITAIIHRGRIAGHKGKLKAEGCLLVKLKSSSQDLSFALHGS